MKRFILALFSIPLALGVLGQNTCGDDDEESPTPEPSVLAPFQDGCGHQIVVASDPFVMRLESDSGTLVSRLGAGGLRIGTVPEVLSTYNYDPYSFYQLVFPEAIDGPDGLAWESALRLSSWSMSGNSLQLEVLLSNDEEITLAITPSCPTAFDIEVFADASTTAYVGLDFDAPEDERYYGLGEYFDSVEHRSRLRAMQFEVALEQEDGYNQAHVPVPFFASTAGWGVFVRDYHPGIFDLANTTPDQVRIEYGARSLNWFWMAARPMDLVTTYTHLTGAPAVPPIWAFAPIQWRDEVSGQDMVLEDAAAIRANDLPGSGIWIDRPYGTYPTSMDFNSSTYPDPEAMVESLHDSGFRMAAWCAPYLHEDDPDFQTAQDNDWLVGGYTQSTTDFGWLVDYTHPDLMDFWQSRVLNARSSGFDGWKLDYGEDIIQGIGEVATELNFDNGETAATLHHRFSELYHQAHFNPYQPDDVFILSRTGTYGGQQWTSVIWPGDLCNDFYYYAEEGHVGGLPAAMIAGISLSASGFPFYASDTGGYKHGRASSNVLVRWAQYSAFLPVMQYGGCGGEDPSCNPWDMSDEGENTYTEETLELFRTYADLHMQLFPFFYRWAEIARSEYRPPATAFGLYWPDDGRHPDDQMVLGDALMLAPMVRDGVERTVEIPEGKFVDYWSGQTLVGPQTLSLEIPIERTPIYFLAGAIVPMLRPGVDTLIATSVPEVDSWESSPGRIWGFAVPTTQPTSFNLPFGGGRLWVDGSDSLQAGFEASTTGTDFTGFNLRIYAPDSVEVLQGGTVLNRANSGDTATCAACWSQESNEPWVWVGLASVTDWSLEIRSSFSD